MRAAHVNNSARGGAARIAQMLIASRRDDELFAAKTFGRTDVRPIDSKPDPFLKQHCGGRGLFFCQYQGSHLLPKMLADFDITHLHNIHGDYFNPFSLLLLDRAKPLIWTLHDMFALTGRCAHAYDCVRWQNDCSACTAFGDGIGSDGGLRHKKIIYGQLDCEIVVPSRWLKEKVAQSAMKELRVTHIPNGIDTAVFLPPEYNVLKKRYGVGEDTVLIGSSASGGVLEQEIKGASFVEPFMRAFAQQGKKAVFVNIGSAADGRRGDVIDVPFTADEQVLAEIYGSLDLFVLFSKAETSSLVCMEAMSCGVPCAAFDVGALSEVITPGETGVLVPAFDVDRLAAESVRLISDTRRHAVIRRRTREHAQRCFDVRMMALAYAKMYAQAQTHFETRKAQGVLRVPRIACTREFIAAAGALDCACEAVDATIPADERSVATVYEVYASALDGGDAKGLAEKILAENPSAELEYLLGDALRVGGKIMDACAWFVRAYKKDPRDLSMLIGAGKSLLDAGDTAHARLLAEAAMKAAPFDERVRAFYVKCR